MTPACGKSCLPRWLRPWSCSRCVRSPRQRPDQRPRRAPRQYPRHALPCHRGSRRAEAARRTAGDPDLDPAALYLHPRPPPRRAHRGRHQQTGKTSPARPAPAAPAAAAPPAARQSLADPAGAPGVRRRRLAVADSAGPAGHAGARRRRPQDGPPAAPALPHAGRGAAAGDRQTRPHPPAAPGLRRKRPAAPDPAARSPGTRGHASGLPTAAATDAKSPAARLRPAAGSAPSWMGQDMSPSI